MEDQCVITREVAVAAGVFAPGHLGELTQIVPFEMVDQAVAATGTTRTRVRVLPARVVVYLLLAGCLFAELGYRQVWHKLTAGLGALPDHAALVGELASGLAHAANHRAAPAQGGRR